VPPLQDSLEKEVRKKEFLTGEERGREGGEEGEGGGEWERGRVVGEGEGRVGDGEVEGSSGGGRRGSMWGERRDLEEGEKVCEGGKKPVPSLQGEMEWSGQIIECQCRESL